MMIQASFEDSEKSKGTNISTIPFKLMVAVICFPCTWVTKSPPVKVRAKLGSSPRKSGKCWNYRNGPYDQDLGLYICIPSVSRELLTIKCLKKRENLSAFLKKFFGRLRSWLHNFVTFKQKSVSLHWCSEIDSTRRQNVIKMKKWHSVQPSMALGQWTRKNFYSYWNIKFLRILIITAEKIYSTIYGINNRNWFSSSTPFPAQTITVFIGQLE